MGKTRAEIQKAYRERKKAQKGNSYLKEEAKRVKTYYIPTDQLSKHKLLKRRKKIKNAMKKKRLREKQDSNNSSNNVNNENGDETVVNNIVTDTEIGPCDSTTDTVMPSSSTSTPITCTSSSKENRLLVKMNFPVKGRGRKNASKPLKIAQSEIRKLKHKLDNVRRKNSVLRQRLSRINRHKMQHTNMTPDVGPDSSGDQETTSTPKNQFDSTNITPRRRSRSLLRSSGLSPRRHKLIAKKLQLHESMVDDMKCKDSAINLVCGNTAKRSRQMSAISKSLSVNRKKMLRTVRGPTIIQRRKIVEKARIREKVTEFMARDDNSSCLPGKADCLKTEDGTQQKRVLNDLLSNLHVKFRSENLDIKINVSTFGSHRPKNIKLVHYSSRKTCLCQRHQNMALKVKGLRSAGISTATNPDSYVRQATDDELLNEIQQHDSTSIKYTEWQRVEVEHKGRNTKRMQIVQIEKPKTEFIDIMKKDIMDFRSHCHRVKAQYEEVKRLKEKIPADHAIIQMDFAENYVCSHADEVQSAYFDKGAVTLHPTVIYYKNSDGKLVHESHVIVSDTQMHNSGTVLAFIREIVPVARQLINNLKMIHYVTDSPTSQYRNKHMFFVVTNHHTLFDGVTASWQYFEAGHGKGPCDGVGGTAKRQADSAVKRQVCCIQNADDFFAWGSSQQHGNLKYMFVSNMKCIEASDYLKRLNIKPVKGTMSVHSVFSLGNNCIAVRNTSCVCDECFSEGVFHTRCIGWSTHNIESTVDVATDHIIGNNDDMVRTSTQVNAIDASACSSNTVSTDQNERSATDEIVGQQYATNAYVAALYDLKWYVGKILEYDPEDDTYQISFMTEGSNKRGVTFKWPDKEDILWLPDKSILCAIEEPILYGKTRRLYKLSVEDLERVENLFEH